MFSSLTKSRNSKVSVQNQIKPKSQCEFVPQDIEKSDFLDLADAGDGAFSVETVISSKNSLLQIFVVMNVPRRVCKMKYSTWPITKQNQCALDSEGRQEGMGFSNDKERREGASAQRAKERVKR